MGMGCGHSGAGEGARNAGSSSCGEANPVPGGYGDASTTDDRVVAAAEFAATELGLGTYDIACAQTQVVAGTNFRMVLVSEGKEQLVVVYADLDDSFSMGP